jgi:FixJ family two-component response regulator
MYLITVLSIVCVGLIIFASIFYRQYVLRKTNSELAAKEVRKNDIEQIEEGKLNHVARITDLEHQLRESKLKLAIVAKESEDKSVLLKNLGQLLDNAVKNPLKESIVLHEITRLLESHQLKDDKIFALQMSELNQDNLKKLKKLYPILTNSDLKLCILIMAGLNSKEIANSMEVLPSSIYISRSRLRKKLHLDNDEDLQGFLNNIM